MNWNAFILIALKILAVIALVLLNGFFVAAEFSLVRIRETQLDALVAKNRRRAKMARHIVRHLNSYLSATQLGITMVSLGLGYLGEPIFSSLLGPIFNLFGLESTEWIKTISLVVGFSVLTFLSVVAGELAPKWLTIQKPLPIALWSAYPLHWFYIALYPFNRLLNHAARFLLEKIGISPDAKADGGHSEEELRLVLASTQNTAGGRNIVMNALDLRHRIVREVMRPRQEIAAFNSGATVAECLALAEKTRYSRFPLCENGNLDKTLGIVHIKDLYALRDKARTAADLLPVARKLIYVPETAPLEKLLQVFLERKLHFAVVVDEYGGTVGIVTLENALEALVGQIQDEFDSEKSELVRAGENAWEAAGTLPLHELEKIIGEVPHDESVTTASGWLTEKLGGFPKAGDSLAVGIFELRVEEMDGPRVARLKITKRGDAKEPGNLL
ncbi:MAG TPA: hemolysin family protein [Candidatus Paceibacterota bacterium]|nr:hemolysin family protein [Candidatus Paceibacterota bacterium]